MDFLFLADPIEKLKPQGDSTLAMVRAGLRRPGWRIYWCLSRSVEYRNGEVYVRAAQVVDCPSDELPRLSSESQLPLGQFRAVMIRKDPPFDEDYLRLCWILSLAEPKVRFINRPSLLLRYHEKLMALEALSQGFVSEAQTIPTLIGQPQHLIPVIRDLGWSSVVSKPFLGFGGQGVRLWSFAQFSSSCFLEEESVFQPYIEGIREIGDRRVFYLNGKWIGDFVRLPPAGGFVSNLAQGGRAIARPLDEEEKKTVDAVGRFLAHSGITLAGADLIGTKVSEINITSPTGIQSIRLLEKRDISEEILDAAAGDS